jgi:uncharacterized protein
MLHGFEITNYASIRDKQVVSLVARDRHDNIAVRKDPSSEQFVLPASGVFGANASGKSKVVEALAFLREAVVASHQQWTPTYGVPRVPFAFDDESRAAPTRLAIDFVVDEVRYRYGFLCDDEEFTEEFCFSYPEQRRRLVFHRVRGERVRFGTHFTGPGRLIESVTRPNSLFLSAAAANNHPELSRVYQWFDVSLRIADEKNTARRLAETLSMFDAGDRERVLKLVALADLDIVDIRKVERELPKAAPEIRLVHKNNAGEGTLSINNESSGTQTWLALIGAVLSTLDSGGVLVVDELDARLHPALAGSLLAIFQSRESNTNGAQIFFNSHDLSLLGPHVEQRLRRDQVWFASKETGSTVLFPLAEYRVREGLDNVERAYHRGRYGAVPFIDQALVDGIARQA